MGLQKLGRTAFYVCQSFEHFWKMKIVQNCEYCNNIIFKYKGNPVIQSNFREWINKY